MKECITHFACDCILQELEVLKKDYGTCSAERDTLIEKVRVLKEALQFYEIPESIEPFLQEFKIPGTNNTRPAISLRFYSKAIEALQKVEDMDK